MRKQICLPLVTSYSLKVYRFASAPFNFNNWDLLIPIEPVLENHLKQQINIEEALKDYNLADTKRETAGVETSSRSVFYVWFLNSISK